MVGLNRRSYMGKENPNYRHGKSNCGVCGKELSEYKYKLCRKCYLKELRINTSKEELIELYVNEKLSMYKIAKIMKCSPAFICLKLQEYNIKARSTTEGNNGAGNPNYKGIIRYCKDCKIEINPYTESERCWNCYVKYSRGKNHPSWEGGKSFEIYPLGWTNTHREQIRYRDGYTCQICGVPEVECNKKLHVHHKDYDKKNIITENLISLCHSCHSKTNTNREHWIKYFTEVICILTTANEKSLKIHGSSLLWD